MAAPVYARRRAGSGRVRGYGHLVEVKDPTKPLVWSNLSTTSVCGFRPKRSWSSLEAPAWEDTCPKCDARKVTDDG